jgi:hypothetical protein
MSVLQQYSGSNSDFTRSHGSFKFTLIIIITKQHRYLFANSNDLMTGKHC